MIPFWHGKKLYKSALGKKMYLWIDDAMHNDYAYVAGAGAEYFEAVEAFIEMVREE